MLSPPGLPERLTARTLLLSHERDGTMLALLLRRADADEFRAGEWDLPGGRANDGETAEVAASRELFEESGLRLAASGLYLFYDRTEPGVRDGQLVSIRRTVWEGRILVPAGEVAITLNPEEHSAYDWMPPLAVPEALGSPHYSAAVRDWLPGLPRGATAAAP